MEIMYRQSLEFEFMYAQILADTLAIGSKKPTRTGEVISTNSPLQLTVHVSENRFPILRGKKMFFNTIKTEAEWFLSGRNDIAYLHERGVHIWDAWERDGKVDISYNKIAELIPLVVTAVEKNEINSRRLYVNLYDPESILPACYTSAQIFFANDRMHMHVNFRSSDLAVGLPYDICVLTYIMHVVLSHVHAVDTKYKLGALTMYIVDAHINVENIDPCIKYLEQLEKLSCVIEEEDQGPKLVNMNLINYRSAEAIKMHLAT